MPVPLVPHQHHATCLQRRWDYVAMGSSHGCEMGDMEHPEMVFSLVQWQMQKQNQSPSSHPTKAVSPWKDLFCPLQMHAFPPEAHVIVLVNTLFSTCISLLSVLQKLVYESFHTAFVWSEESLYVTLKYFNSRELEEPNMAKY